MSRTENSWPCSVRSEELRGLNQSQSKSGEGGQPRVQGGTFAARLAVTMKSAPRRGPTGLRAHPDLGRTRPPCRRATAQGRPASLLEGRFAREAARFHASRRRSAERACTSNGSERGEFFFLPRAKRAARKPPPPLPLPARPSTTSVTPRLSDAPSLVLVLLNRPRVSFSLPQQHRASPEAPRAAARLRKRRRAPRAPRCHRALSSRRTPE